jgi:hypothetical protein
MEPWEWSLGYNLERRLSNFAFVDPQEVSVYESYNSYAEHTFNASLSRGFDDWGFLASPRLAFNGSASTRMYDTRPAKTADGNYSGQKQHDEIYLATLELTNKFSDHWGGYASVNWSAYRSNTANETSSLYNYNFVSLSLGTQFSY